MTPLAFAPDPYLVNQDHDLALVQVGPGVATIDFGYLGIGTAISGRLAGSEMRHWFAAWDIDGNTFLVSRQLECDGYWSHPANHDGATTAYSRRTLASCVRPVMRTKTGWTETFRLPYSLSWNTRAESG